MHDFCNAELNFMLMLLKNFFIARDGAHAHVRVMGRIRMQPLPALNALQRQVCSARNDELL